MDSATRKKLRRIAHHLQPVIIIGDGGLSDGLVAETEPVEPELEVDPGLMRRDERRRPVERSRLVAQVLLQRR